MRLQSGRELNVYGDVIGIGPDLEAKHGFDGALPYVRRPDHMDGEEWASADRLTPDEQIEIADVMLARWAAFRCRAVAAKG